LCWEDVDLDARTLSVKRTLSGAEGSRPVFGAPKTAKSRPTVGLTDTAVETLERHRVAQEEERSRLGPLWHNLGLVFRSTTSTPVNRHNLMNRSFKPLLEKAGFQLGKARSPLFLTAQKSAWITGSCIIHEHHCSPLSKLGCRHNCRQLPKKAILRAQRDVVLQSQQK
jgi:hypothetical protein